MTTPTYTPDDIAEMLDELEAHRNGRGHVAEDVMHAGQPVHETRNSTDEPSYWLQITHRRLPMWSCAVCSRITIGEPTACAHCNDGPDDLGPLLYPSSVGCRSWSKRYGGQYGGPCLIAGSDGCECTTEDTVVQPSEAAEVPSAAVDLMTALRASLDRAKQARGERLSTARSNDRDTARSNDRDGVA